MLSKQDEARPTLHTIHHIRRLLFVFFIRWLILASGDGNKLPGYICGNDWWDSRTLYHNSFFHFFFRADADASFASHYVY